MKLLQEKGIAALTQPRVARAAGIKQSHLTYYFPARADLLLAIAEAAIATTMGNIAAQLEKSPRRATLAATVAAVMTAGVPTRVVIGLIVAADADPQIRRPLRKLLGHVRGQVRALLSKAGADASDEAALLFHAAVVGLALMHQAQRNAKSAREVKEGVGAMLRLLALLNQQHATKGSI